MHLIRTIPEIGNTSDHVISIDPEIGNTSDHMIGTIPEIENATNHMNRTVPEIGNASDHMNGTIPEFGNTSNQMSIWSPGKRKAFYGIINELFGLRFKESGKEYAYSLNGISKKNENICLDDNLRRINKILFDIVLWSIHRIVLIICNWQSEWLNNS